MSEDVDPAVSGARPSPPGSLARRRAARRLSLAAIAGVAFGVGLSIGTNVAGGVLASYGIVLALLVAAGTIAARRAFRTERSEGRAAPTRRGRRDAR